MDSPSTGRLSASRIGVPSQQAGCCCVEEARCFSHLCQTLPSNAATLHCNAPSSQAIPSGRMEGGKRGTHGGHLRGQLEECRESWHLAPAESGSNHLPPPCTRVCDPLPLPALEQDAAFAALTVAGKQQSSTMLPLQAITIFPCICPGLDASPPASTHELTIPNDVSKSKCFLGMCVRVYMYIYKLWAYDC